MQFYPRILSTIFLMAIAAPLAAADGFYVDGSCNDIIATADFEAAHFANDVDLGAIGLRGGYDLAPYFALQGVMLIGISDGSWYETPGNTESDTTVFSYDTSLNSSVFAFGRTNIPIGDRFTAFARVGFSTVKLETSSGGSSFKDDFSGPAYSIGATVDVTEKVYLRGDLTRYNLDDFENDADSIGAGVRF